jgi:hypothetical protein
LLLSFLFNRHSLLFDYSLGLDAGVSATLGSILISLLALSCLGRPLAFAVGLAALMLSYSGWDTLSVSANGNRTRSYFGIYEVRNRTDGNGAPIARTLTHGTTLHGIQNLLPGVETLPTSYYARGSGVGLALANATNLYGANAHVGVIGLGTGTLACYAQPGQRWTFFEIDRHMEEVARTNFSFLSRCAPQAQVVIGDARLSIQRQPAGQFHLLAVDAFSSDSVPMHLLTREALAIYGDAMHRDGIVLFHISNRYLNLEPVIAELAQSGGWESSILVYQPTEEEEVMNATVSIWIALSRNPRAIARLVELSGPDADWSYLTPTPGFAGWSDDHASILPLIRYPAMPWE